MAPVFGVKIFNKRLVIHEGLFGENKTWVGFLSGLVFGIIGAVLQGVLYAKNEFFRSISIIDYGSINLIYLGYFLGFASMSGDLFKSFIKRRIGIKSGDRFIPFDQIDFVVSSFIFLSIIDFVGWGIIIVGILFTFILHIAVNHLGYFLGLRNTKW